MSFLAPLFLLGALSIALPIVFHLIRRTSKEQMPFSTLMFLQPTLPRVTKRNKLEHILLLLLRCLVVALLALAFARPFFQRPWTAPLSSETGQSLILLMDTSASMRRAGLWPTALAKAAETLRKTSPADRVAIYTFDRQARPFLSFEQWSQMPSAERSARSVQRLAGLKPGWAATHLGNALVTAAEAFTEADRGQAHVGPRRIVLISDLQEGSRLEGLQGYDWPRGLEVQIEPIHAQRTTNAGLQWVLDTEATSETNAAPRLRLSNSADAKREQFQLHWAGLVGKAPLDVYVPPGQNRVVPAPPLPPGTSGDRIVLTGDDDDFDNTVYVLPPKAEEIQVFFLGDEGEKDPTQLLYYLKRAFPPTRRQVVHLKSQPTSTPLVANTLKGVRLLIAADRLPDNQVETLRAFVAGGGTILFVVKNSAAGPTLGRLAGLDDLVVQEAKVANYAMFGLIDFEQPLFAPFSDSRYNDFTKIHFWKYRRLQSAKSTGLRALAKFDNGDAALAEIPQDKGRLLILTSGWQPSDSQLALSSKFVPLLYALLDLAGGVQAPAAQFHVGDTVELGSLAETPSQPLTVRKPDGALVQLAAGGTRFEQTDAPGIYSVMSVEPPLRFAVNLEGSESRTAMLPIDELERLGVPLRAREVDRARQMAQKRHLHNTELENQQKWWRWLTVAAAVLLLIETSLAGWVTRQTTVQTL